MEKKFFKEVVVVLLPPLLNQLELGNDSTVFLDLGEIVKLNSSQIVLGEKVMKTPSALVSKIAKTDFSKEIISLINSRGKELTLVKIVLINYPMNKNQLESLERTLELAGFNISKLVVISLASFDVLVTAKEENFLCPICLRSYARKVFLKQDRYLCPLDKEDFAIPYINKFTDYLTTYYLQNSIEVIQNFVEGEKKVGRRILNISIGPNESSAEDIKKSLLNVVGKE